MNKDETIEQMAKDLVDEIEFDITFYDFNGSVGIHFDYDCTAKNVVEKGYRKVGEDEIVMSKEAYYEALNAAQESGKCMGYAKGREETAREIFEDIEFFGVRSLRDDEIWGNHLKLTERTMLDLKMIYGIDKDKGTE